MKHSSAILIAATVFAAQQIFALPGDGGYTPGGGIMDDLVKPFDDSAVELPGEKARKPSVSRSQDLVNERDTWGMREDSVKKTEKKAEKKSSSTTSLRDSASDKTVYVERNSTAQPSGHERIEYQPLDPDDPYKAENPFKNNYKYGETYKQKDGRREEFSATREKIKEVFGAGVPKVIADPKLNSMLSNPAREAALLAPTTPNRWDRAPNSWFCDYDNALAKAKESGRTIAVFFHSSNNENSRKFLSDLMESSKFRVHARENLLVVYMNYPDKWGTDDDKRYQGQIDHNRRIADQFHVNSYPTLVFVSPDGAERGRISGLNNSTRSFMDEVERLAPRLAPAEKKE